jgi:hypothetical protein
MDAEVPQLRSSPVASARRRTAGLRPAGRMSHVIAVHSRIMIGVRRFLVRTAGEFHCPLCAHVLETFDGSTEVAYRLTVAPEKLLE